MPSGVVICDGSCVGGQMRIGCVLTTCGRSTTASRALGDGTNNVAEYGGVIAAMKLALKHGVTDLVLKTDSKLVVGHVVGGWKADDSRLRELRNRVYGLMKEFRSVKIEWVPREQTEEAHALAGGE